MDNDEAENRYLRACGWQYDAFVHMWRDPLNADAWHTPGDAFDLAVQRSEAWAATAQTTIELEPAAFEAMLDVLIDPPMPSEKICNEARRFLELYGDDE